jgi:hypothetical protein
VFKQDDFDDNKLFIRFIDQESRDSMGDGNVDLTVQIPIQAEAEVLDASNKSPLASSSSPLSPLSSSQTSASNTPLGRGPEGFDFSQAQVGATGASPQSGGAFRNTLGVRTMSILRMDADTKRRRFCEGQVS